MVGAVIVGAVGLTGCSSSPDAAPSPSPSLASADAAVLGAEYRDGRYAARGGMGRCRHTRT